MDCSYEEIIGADRLADQEQSKHLNKVSLKPDTAQGNEIFANNTVGTELNQLLKFESKQRLRFP